MRTPLRSQQTNQDGNILIMASIVLSTAIILLASIDIGFLFYQKRELQKIADMAAIAGAQQLSKADCSSAPGIAISNAQQHGFPLTPNVTVGRWDPTIPNSQYFEPTACSESPNAVRVEVNRNFGSFFGAWASQSVHASAIATGSPTEPYAIFSVESALLKIDESGVIPTLLSELGLNIDGTSLVSNSGLANAYITPGGLLRALGFDIPLNVDVATIESIVSLNSTAQGCAANSCPLGEVLKIIKIGEQGQTLDISTLGLTVDQLDTDIRLLSTEEGRGILSLLGTANGSSALNANINALEFVKTAIAAANSGNAAGLDLGTNISGVLSAETKIGVVEPPSIGFGGEGATAFTSQIRVFTRVESNLLNANLLHANLPIALDIVNGKAQIIKPFCESKDEYGYDEVTFKVEAPLLTACVGKMTANTAFSKKASCAAGLQDERLINILGNTLSLNTHILLNGLTNDGEITLSMHEANRTGTIGKNDLPLGDLVKNLTDIVAALVASVLGQLLNQGQGGITNTTLASELLKNNSLTGALTLLDTSLTSLTSFVSELQPAVSNLLQGSLSSLLNVAGNLVGGLLDGLGNFLNLTLRCGLFPTDQCKLALNLEGNQAGGGQTVSNVLLSILGLVTQLFKPILDQLGSVLANQLHAILGANLGEVQVTLIDLQCGGESNVRLVY